MKNNKLFVQLAILLVAITAVLIFVVIPRISQGGKERVGVIGLGSDTVKGEVLEIVEEGVVQMGDREQPYQLLKIKVLEGPWEGQELIIDYGQRQVRPAGLVFEIGDKLLVTIGQDQNQVLSAYFADYVRTGPLLLLFFTFMLFSVLISGWKGVRGLIGLMFSVGVIILYIIPKILEGGDPLLISISGSFIIMAVTIYLIYGWTLKSHAAVMGTLLALIVTGLLAGYFVNLTRLTGFGSEDALFLIQQAGVSINLRGIVLGGMLIGALGVLDDLVITQASVVFELHNANNDLSFKELFKMAMRVGQDHVAATVNTLVLAYAGAALPALILFSLSGERYIDLINLEFVAEEVVRTLVGSLGLIAAVPITTILAAWLARYHDRLGKYEKILGGLGEGHSHHH